jgi:chromosomal replication initiation ATPase DnaA
MQIETIEEVGRRGLKALNLSLKEVKKLRGTQTITQKKILFYLFLRNNAQFSWVEIAQYTYKDHSTIHKLCNKYAKMWDRYKHIFYKSSGIILQ